MKFTFEFTLGHYIFIGHGPIWSLITISLAADPLALGMLVVMFSPAIAAKLRILNQHLNG